MAADPADANAPWTFVGPTHLGFGNAGGGRIADLAVDPTHAGTVYAATAGGGVWKTTDAGNAAGAHFTSVWPNNLPSAIGAIAVDKNGVIWAGTGETNPGGGSITFYGSGIYKSTDGGATWQNMGLNDSWTIARIVISPTDPNEVWVAVSGNLFLSGHQRGVYVTKDGGATWTQSLAPPNGTTGASDLAISQQHPATIFVGMWDHVRVPDHRTYTGVGSGVWETTNDGQTWTDISSPANTPTNHLRPDGDPNNGRIGLAIAPSDDHFIYVNYANGPTGAEQAVFSSTDGGATFTLQSQATADLAAGVEQNAFVYGWWFAKTFVDPVNPQHVFFTDLCLWQSTNGASTVSKDCAVHADQHAIAWDPNVPNQVYAGDDGGFYTSTTNGTAGSFKPALVQPWPMFVSVDVSEQDPTRIMGGLQDNSTQVSWDSQGNSISNGNWRLINGGDGQNVLINPQDKNNVYSCSQYGVCSVSFDGGNSNNQFGGSGDGTPGACTDQSNNPATCAVTTRNAYQTPFTFDPTNPATVYYAGDVVNVSHDHGNNWTVISPDLGGANPGTELDPLYAGHYGVVTTISVSKAPDSNTVWVGTDSGYTWKTDNASSSPAMPTWTQMSGPNSTMTGNVGTLPARWVSKVYIDPNNKNIVYVAFSGFRSGDNHAYIERSNNGGNTWTDLSAGLPEATVNDMVLTPQQSGTPRLWLATDTGVYASDPSQNPETSAFTWRSIGAGTTLPNISVTGLRFIPPPPPPVSAAAAALPASSNDGTLFISTFGRGVWSLALSEPSTDTPEAGLALLLPVAGGTAIGGAFAIRVRRRRRRAAQLNAGTN
ncbi:MAG: WD40/YVTN/BNR-like repeat-containing protein [Candidatus Dormibacteria bacterium]